MREEGHLVKPLKEDEFGCFFLRRRAKKLLPVVVDNEKDARKIFKKRQHGKLPVSAKY